MIVKYFEENGVKKFDVVQALKDSGWGVRLESLLGITGLELVDRRDSAHQVVVSSITLDRIMQMYFVSYHEGGWQCLDHAIEQFGPQL